VQPYINSTLEHVEIVRRDTFKRLAIDVGEMREQFVGMKRNLPILFKFLETTGRREHLPPHFINHPLEASQFLLPMCDILAQWH